jgi:chromosome segregation ATPase
LERKRAEIDREERRIEEERAELERQKAQLKQDREGLSDLRGEVSSAFDIQLKSALEYVDEYQRYLREKEARLFNSRDPDDVAHARRIAALTGESERAIFRAMFGYVDELGGIAA